MNCTLKLIAAVLLLGLALVAGCGKEESTPGTPGAKVHIGVSIPTATHGWPAGVGWWAEETMKKYPGVAWEFQRASTAAEQASQIETMIEKGITGLVVLPFDSDTPLPAIKKAGRQGIYIVSVDRGLREPVADIYLAGDNAAFGRKSAEYMVQKLNGKGNIVILRGMPVEIDTERYEAAMAVFNKSPGIKVLDAQPGNWNRADAHNVMQNFLTKYNKIDAVWASDDDMALGVEQALREASRQNEMWILGGAGMKDIVKRVMDKDVLFPADITYPPGMISAGIDIAVAKLRDGDIKSAANDIHAHLGALGPQLERISGKEGQQKITIDVFLITPENGSTYYFPESIY
jgi:ribose transport system substrate-binding protein